MSIDNEEASLLFEIKKNQLKMVARRGYDIRKESQLFNIQLSDFLKAYISAAEKQNKTFREVLFNVYAREDDPDDKLLVYYADVDPSKTQMSNSEVGKLDFKMTSYNSKNAIVITPKPLSSGAKKDIAGLVSYNIQTFLEEEMAYDPTEHMFVPEHIPLSDEEQREFLTGNDISFDQLPIIRTNDIIVRYYGLRQGQIMKIIRTNMYDTMTSREVVYRAVRSDAELL